jgi:hypothetical protein
MLMTICSGTHHLGKFNTGKFHPVKCRPDKYTSGQMPSGKMHQRANIFLEMEISSGRM